MEITVKEYTKDRIPDVLSFERRLREEENDWGWVIDDAYIASVEKSYGDPRFGLAISYLAYVGGLVVGRIDASLIPSRFDGSVKAYLDWICVVKSSRHKGVGQALMASLRARLKEEGVDTLIALTASNDEAQRFYHSVTESQMHDIGIWIDVK